MPLLIIYIYKVVRTNLENVWRAVFVPRMRLSATLRTRRQNLILCVAYLRKISSSLSLSISLDARSLLKNDLKII